MDTGADGYNKRSVRRIHGTTWVLQYVCAGNAKFRSSFGVEVEIELHPKKSVWGSFESILSRIRSSVMPIPAE